MSRPHWDVVVIGAGPAGSVAAHGLARKGYRVLLADKAAFPRNKVCGGCLNKHAVEMLQDVGLESVLDQIPGTPLQEFQLGVGGKIVSFPLPGGRAVSRMYLDAALAEKAKQAGADFFPETKARLGPLGQDMRTVYLSTASGDTAVSAGVVLICHGLDGKILPEEDESAVWVDPDSRFGVSAILEDNDQNHYRPGTLYMAYDKQGYAGLVRLEDGHINVAAALNFSKEKNEPGVLGRRVVEIFRSAGFPEIHSLAQANWTGTLALTRSRKNVAGQRYLLLGDAAGYSEPFTGEGMAWAFDSAVFISRMIQAPSGWNETYTAVWQKAYRRLILPRRRFSRQVALGLRHPAFVQSVSGLLSRSPGLIRPWVRAVCEPSLL